MLKPVALIALCAASAVAGCGSSASSRPLSMADFIAKGDAICQRINAGLRSAGQTATAADVVRVAPKVHALEQQGLNDLRKLRPPREAAGDWSTILHNLRTLTDNATKIGEAAKRDDVTSARAIAATSNAASLQVGTLAAKLGFKVCSTSS